MYSLLNTQGGIHLQIGPALDNAMIGMPGILLGLLAGYIIGGLPNYRVVDRIGLGIVLSGAGGLVLSFIMMDFFIPVGPFEMMFSILAFAGGYILGLVLNWKSPINTKRKNHIIYEPEDDDEDFDREIEEALGG
jgi:hypothetical protein